MKHPLEFVPVSLRKPFFYFFLALTVVILSVFNQLDQSLRTAAAPNGMISFELAGSVASSRQILDSWNADARLAAAFALGLDYLFMPVYALAFSLGLILARGKNLSRYRSFANLMGWGVFIAAFLDAVENYALWQILNHGAFSPYPQLAAICATIKFVLLIFGLVTAAVNKFIR